MLFPVLFLHFVLDKLGRNSSYRLVLKTHYTLAFAIIGLTLVNILLVLFSGNTLLELLGWKYLEPFYMGQQYYAFLLTVSAFVIALRETWRYRSLIRNEISDFELLGINWLWQYIFVIAPIILFWGAELFRIALGGKGQSELTTVAYIFIALFNYFVSYKAFIHQTLFEGSALELKAMDEVIDTKLSSSYKSSAPIDDEICLRIQNEMAAKELYLNQNLTIHDFAREIQISARTISSCVNQRVGYNFNEWVNNFRVERAKGLLKDPKRSHLSIEGIGSDSGFKSRSAMYAAFRRKLGVSPGNFR
jgi:AraC-like DNA-binding protein